MAGWKTSNYMRKAFRIISRKAWVLIGKFFAYWSLMAYSANPFGEKKIAIATRANPREPIIPTGKGPSSGLG
jgi:hypothetical protein